MQSLTYDIEATSGRFNAKITTDQKIILLEHGANTIEITEQSGYQAFIDTFCEGMADKSLTPQQRITKFNTLCELFVASE